MLTANGEPAMPPNERLNGGKLDLVIFADQFTLGVSSKRPKAIGTMQRLMILNGIGRFAQFTRMAFVSGLGAAGLGLLAPLFSIRRWRFGRRARSLVRTLKPKHQLDQIVLAQPLQIIAIHPNLESATRPTRKGWVITMFLQGPQTALVAGFHEFMDERSGGREGDAVTLLAGRQPQCQGDMGFARAGGTESDAVLALLDPFAARQ